MIIVNIIFMCGHVYSPYCPRNRNTVHNQTYDIELMIPLTQLDNKVIY